MNFYCEIKGSFPGSLFLSWIFKQIHQLFLQFFIIILLTCIKAVFQYSSNNLGIAEIVRTRPIKSGVKFQRNLHPWRGWLCRSNSGYSFCYILILVNHYWVNSHSLMEVVRNSFSCFTSQGSYSLSCVYIGVSVLLIGTTKLFSHKFHQKPGNG